MKPEDWFTSDVSADIDLAAPGIHVWRIEGVGDYVGKATKLRSRLRQYRNNIRKMVEAQPYRRGKPDAFRRIHVALAEARTFGRPVVFNIIENCPRGDHLLQRERYWIATLKPVLNGPLRLARDNDG